MVVKKYGGSSVADTVKILNIAKYLKNEHEKGEQIVVVVSAMGKTTNHLISLAKEITNTPDLRELDRLMSTGENQSIALLSIALNSLGVKAISYTAEQINLKTSGMHGKSIILDLDEKKIRQKLYKGYVVIIAGFQGINEKRDVTTLGRGGSDTTAVALAAKLNAKCEIYTDVEGIYTIDPRIFPDAKKIDYISYEEMMELSYLGAGVMEPRAVELGYKYKVPIYVAKSLSEKSGTYITFKENIDMEQKTIRGISVNENILMVTLDGIATYAKNLEPIFNKLLQYGINIDLVSHNDVISEKGSIAFTAAKTDIEQIKKAFEELDLENVDLVINEQVVKVSIVGIGMMTTANVMTNIFSVLSRNNLSFHQISSSEVSISLIVDSKFGNIIAGLLAEQFSI